MDDIPVEGVTDDTLERLEALFLEGPPSPLEASVKLFDSPKRLRPLIETLWSHRRNLLAGPVRLIATAEMFCHLIDRVLRLWRCQISLLAHLQGLLLPERLCTSIHHLQSF
jgi:hypothetical protein